MTFIDPFRPDYVKSMFARVADDEEDRPVSDRDALRNLSPMTFLRELLEVLKKQIRSPLDDKSYRKVSWLYDRIARQLGVPPASSYSRP